MIMDPIIHIDDNRSVDHSVNQLKQPNPEKPEKNNSNSSPIIKSAPEEIGEYLKEYSAEERFEWALQKKLKANRLFVKKNYDEAMQFYTEATFGMENEDSSQIEELHSRFINEVKISSLLSIAACLNEKKDFQKALSYCDEAIKISPTQYKCYHRRGVCYINLKEWNKANDDLKKSIELCQDEFHLQPIKKLYDQVKELRGRKASKDAEEIILNGDSLNGSIDRENNNSSDNLRVLKYNDDLEELSHLGVLKYVAYPFKMTFRFFKNKGGCCRRKKDSYVVTN